MGRYFFKITDQESSLQPDRSYEFDSSEDAESEAKVALAEMAVDGLPGLAGGALAVEVRDAGRRPLVVYRLVMEVVRHTGLRDGVPPGL